MANTPTQLIVKARYREKHREELRRKGREYQAERRAADPEYAERGRQRIRELTLTNPEYLAEIRKRSYAKHAEKRRAEAKAYKLAHPEKVAEWLKRRDPAAAVEASRRWSEKHPELARKNAANASARRRARKRDALVESVDRYRVYERDGGKCHLCGRPVARRNFHVDHLVPLSRGGSHSYKNVAIAHPRCNMRRGAGLTPAQLRLVG